MVQNRITFGGLASGLDTNAIIDALMDIQRRPITTQEIRREDTLEKQQTLQAVGSSFSSLLATLDALKKAGTFTTQGTSVLAAADDANKVLASANGNAAIGSFDLDVVQVATSTRARSASAIGQEIDSTVPLDQAGSSTGSPPEPSRSTAPSSRSPRRLRRRSIALARSARASIRRRS